MEEMDATAPSEVPQDKSKKYDRQLRLWGDHGQAALEAAKVCLINATATGTEILKNLILPGIGSFTIVDGQKVTGEDVGNNFFLDQSSIGQPRAQATTELLLELNEDVHGDFIEENVDTLLEKNPSFFSNFSIVIASNLRERSLLRLASTLWESDVPLLICRSYGFIGLVRLIVREHTVIESHPSNAFEDLRLDKPFTGLINFCDSLDLDKMDSKDHSHTPWLVVLYKYLQIYKSQHDGTIPRLSKDKNVLKDLIKSGIHRTQENGQMEENFDEAIRNVNTALLPTNVTSEVQAIFNDESCLNLHSESKPFWILARAVKNFVEQEGKGLLPLRGSIPDMTSDSTRFIALQKVYHEQAELDVAQVSAHVQKILESLGRVRGDEPLSMERINQQKHSPASSPGKPQDHISDDDIKTFCKNSAFLRVIRCKPLSSEHEGLPSPSLTPHRDDQEQPDDALWYVLMRAVDRFEGEHNRYPGSDKASFESDISQLKNCLNKLMQEWSITNNIKDDYIHEMCRYGNAELHSVASFIGGVAAQEAIKIVTNQFIPINNTFIYNAANQTSITLEL